jgi:hypothetical protein
VGRPRSGNSAPQTDFSTHGHSRPKPRQRLALRDGTDRYNLSVSSRAGTERIKDCKLEITIPGDSTKRAILTWALDPYPDALGRAIPEEFNGTVRKIRRQLRIGNLVLAHETLAAVG